MSQIFEYRGKVDDVGKTQTFTSGFTKRELIVGNEVSSKYENPVKFTFKKDHCGLLDDIRKGQVVKVRFAVDGRRWDGPKGTQFFVDLTGIGIEAVGADGGASSTSVPQPATPPPFADEPADDEPADDDMPF